MLDVEVLVQVHADVWASVFNETSDDTTSGVPNSLNDDAAVAPPVLLLPAPILTR